MVRGIHHVSMKCASLPFLPCVPGSRSAPDRWMRKSNCSVKSPINPERYSAAAPVYPGRPLQLQAYRLLFTFVNRFTLFADQISVSHVPFQALDPHIAPVFAPSEDRHRRAAPEGSDDLA